MRNRAGHFSVGRLIEFFTALSCAIDNNRAARLYEKRGRTRVRTMTNRLEISSVVFELKVWRYEKEVVRKATTTSGE